MLVMKGIVFVTPAVSCQLLVSPPRIRDDERFSWNVYGDNNFPQFRLVNDCGVVYV